MAGGQTRAAATALHCGIEVLARWQPQVESLN